MNYQRLNLTCIKMYSFAIGVGSKEGQGFTLEVYVSDLGVQK